MNLPEQFRKSLRHACRRRLVRRILIAAGAAWTLALLTALVYTWPAASRYDNAAAQVEAKTRLLADADRLDAIAHSYHTALEQLPRIERRLNAPLRQTGLIHKIRDLARRHHLTITGESFREGQPYKQWDVIEQDIALRGNYAGLTGFLTGLDRLPTWTVIAELRVERARTPRSVKATIRLLTYGKGRHDDGARVAVQ